MEERDIDGRVLYQKDGPIARIVLNWPQRANSQDSRMVWAFDEALTEADRDYDVKVLILKANGKGFCAGHAMGGGEAGGDPYPEFTAERAVNGLVKKASEDLFVWPVLRLWEFRKPTIAQVHGYAIGGGTYWAFMPDITICSDDAYFQMPLPQGLGFPTGETMIEPWLFMNYKRTAEYMFQSKTLDAKTALEWGAVNQVVAKEKLEETVEELARSIARAPLTTLMFSKILIKRAWELMGMRSHMQMSSDLLELATKSKDVGEHMGKMRETGTFKPRQMIARRDEAMTEKK